MSDICLIDSPWSSIRTPSIQIGIIKSLLAGAGLRCRDEYLNLRWHKYCAAEISAYNNTVYREISESRGGFGEWVFSIWPKTVDAVAEPLGVPPIDGRLSARGHIVLGELRRIAPAFIRDEVRRLLGMGFRIFGLTTTFAQTAAAVAFAYELKRACTESVIVLGGANCTGEMGEMLAELYPWIDIVFQGEAEGRVVDLFADLVAGRAIRDTTGMIVQSARIALRRGLSQTAGTIPVPSMDQQPLPDFDGYFAELVGVTQATGDRVQLVYETSRGCWWGARKHCTFCGLNASEMAFRSKSGGKVIEELDMLSEKYRIRDFQIVDNILDHRYFKDVLPALYTKKFRLFWEVKASLRREQVEALARAGVREVQPGIESLHATTLRNMQKGVTPITNLRFLKWCLRYGISPVWLILYNIPGDEPEFYHQQAELVPYILHLTPPALVRLELQRFSPFWEEPSKYGIAIHGAHRSYSRIHCASDAQLMSLAYEFEYSHAKQDALEGAIGALREAIQTWTSCHQNGVPPVLTAERCSDLSICVIDSRSGIEVSYTLNATSAKVIDMCDAGIGRIDLFARMPEAELIMAELLDRRLVIKLDDSFLSLVSL